MAAWTGHGVALACRRAVFWASKALAFGSVLSTLVALGLGWFRIGFWPISPLPFRAGAGTDFGGWAAAFTFLVPTVAGLLGMMSAIFDDPIPAGIWLCLRWGLLGGASALVFWFVGAVLARWPK